MHAYLIDFAQAFVSLGAASTKLMAMQPGWDQDSP